MSMLEFATLCGQLLIDPATALENEDVLEALRRKDAEEVERILREEF